MIDIPPAYESIRENPLQNLQYNEQTIAYADALLYVINTNNYNLLSYFQQLKTIGMDKLYILPSGNSFQITQQGIIFIREGKKELRVIHAKNKKNAHITINSIQYHPDGWELCITGKKRGICKKEDGQILPREEIINIFPVLENGSVYLSPEIDSAGKKRETILEVKRDDLKKTTG